MKPEEAIAYYEDEFDQEDNTFSKRNNERLIITIKSLEKQVAKKPDNLCGYSCRACSGRLARQTDLVNQKYCHHCGQKIDWGNEE